MRGWLHSMLILFLILLFLFYCSEFTIHSNIPGRSTQALISNITEIKTPRKVILVIIDSLRYDYLSKFTFIQNTLKRSPSKSFVTKCKVANPTMTTQRIEALMTGSEIFSSTNILKTFFASKISSDNIIDQLSSQKRQSFILGDDTWIKLFSFSGSQTCSNSYNVHDYETCDRPIYQSMIQKMTGDTSYHLLVSHFLSLDHIGHSTGNVHNDEMQEKIKKISLFMERVLGAMDNDTILFVTGDHGMRDDGNHGGSSQNQAQTFLYGYNKLIDFSGIQPGKMISQSDITTTIALYLNIPLPLNAFGLPILQALPKYIVNNKNYTEEIYKNLLSHFQMMIKFYTGDHYMLQISQQDLKNMQSMQQKLEIVRSKLQFLKYSVPNEVVNKLILILISIVSLIIALQVLQINKIFASKKHILYLVIYIVNKFLLAFMLFTVFFSWYLIQNLSNAFLVCFIASIIMLCFQKRLDSFQKKQEKLFMLILVTFLICQIEPQKTGQFQSNFMRFQSFNAILRHIMVKVFIISALFYRFNQQLAKLQERLKYLIISVLCLSHLNYVLTYCLNIQIYFLRIAILILGIVSTVYSIKHKIFHKIHLIVFSTVILLFMGENGPIIVISCYNITKILVQLQVSSIYFGYLSQMIWWFSGNRFEYSGIDVVKSYIFDSNYHPILNGICIIVILISPHLTFFVYSILMSKHQSSYRQIVSNESLQLQQREINTFNYRQKLNKSLDNFSNNYQFLLVPLLALLSSAWNLDYNNSKILFTIIYLPLLFFCLVKYVLVYLMLLIGNFIIKS